MSGKELLDREESRREEGSRLVVVAAMKEELAPLLAECEIRARGSSGRARWWRGQRSGRALDLVATGEGRGPACRGLVGYLDHQAAGISGAESSFAEELRFLLIGVAGALSTDLAAGAAVVCDPVRGLEHGSDRKPFRPFVVVPSDAVAGCLVTVDEVVVSPARRQALWTEVGRPANTAVDMETWYWARELDRRQLPWSALRVISDRADESLPAFLARCVQPDGGISRRRVALHALLRPWTLPDLLRLQSRVRRAAIKLAAIVAEQIERQQELGAAVAS